MKKKFTIIGPKLHGVDYRPFLLASALESGLTGLLALNNKDPTKITVLARGSEMALTLFNEAIHDDKPPEAMVASIEVQDYDGQVPGVMWSYMALSADQMNKAIPILQSMDSKLSNMDHKLDVLTNGQGEIVEKLDAQLSGQDEMNDKLGTLNEKVSTMHGGMTKGFNLLAASQEEMNYTLGVINETLEEGFKETNEIPEVKDRLDRVERNIRILKRSHNISE